MSTQLGTLISLLLYENFGETVRKIGDYLYKWGPNPLAFISKNTGVSIEKTKTALCILIKFGYVTFKAGRSETIANYTIIPDKILLLLRYSRYVGNIKKRYGSDVELLFEQVLYQGIIRATDAIISAAKRKDLQKSPVDIPALRDAFFVLVTNHYLISQPPPTETDAKIPIMKSEWDSYKLPDVDVPNMVQIRLDPSTEIVESDRNVYWRINFDRFHQDMRDTILLNAVKRRTDESGMELMRVLLKLMYVRTEPWAEISNPIPVVEVKDILRKQNNYPSLVQYIDQYLSIIEEDQCSFLRRVSDSSGGQYIINMREIFTQFAWTTVEQIISEKLGSNAARVFRLVRSKKFIEADNIPQLAMMQIKDAKRITYQLLEENFLQMRELRKTQSNTGPIKTFILFHINIDQVVRMLLDMNYKCIYNIKTRRQHYATANKPIIDKKQRADAIELDLKSKVPAEELDEFISELITPSENEMLEKIGATIKQLNTTTLQLDDTLFILQLYMLYNSKTGLANISS